MSRKFIEVFHVFTVIFLNYEIGHSTPSECQIFFFFRCVLSSMLPLRSVGRSNFVRVCVKFNNVDSKTTYFNENCCIM